MVRFMVDLAALSAGSFPLIPVWLGTQHTCISLSFDKFFNLQSILIINGWSNFLFLVIQTLIVYLKRWWICYWFWDEVKSHIDCTSFCTEYRGIIWKRFLKNVSFMYCCTSCYFIQFRSICEDVQVFRIFFLSFSSSSWKIRAWVLFLWNLRSVKIMFGVLIVEGGISGMIVLWISVRSISASPMIVSIWKPKGFMAFSFFWNSSLCLG